jgi:hypothetical protein
MCDIVRVWICAYVWLCVNIFIFLCVCALCVCEKEGMCVHVTHREGARMTAQPKIAS